ncbi:hypothetical protein THASP1DRAFT_28399 [Thamnocephalis sphaerospora]|uniref:Histone chaperone RTT106/FACT complex subunit SPT16-like middle domain-containing protein n=1 Tax=Thamnocephalis sphaerospora TaxID=78915 RepID=A0A4P9XUZ7_9FUNG|nr:hypothetical protein THASP1DRAFT_28399 [Thamnocephalis sphaerospora]|eukprot:RKP09812.1 hypothetical protein THASP1DRAFT_28399 [Thamnocephalis sphaerospora]
MSNLTLITDPATRALAGVLASSGPHATQTIDRIITHFSTRIKALEAEMARCREELQHAQANAAQAAATMARNSGVEGNVSLDSVAADEPASKKRKQPDATTSTVAADGGWASEPAVATVRALSFLAPRKKLDLIMTASGVRLQRPDNGAAETGFAYSRLRDILCLPTPGRPKPHWTVVFVLQGLVTAGSEDDVDVVAFGFAEPTAAVDAAGNSSGDGSKAALVALLARATGRPVAEPSADTFTVTGSSTSAGSAGRTRHHVDCHLKARDGHLFFLANCIFFGFRKPVVYLPLSRIGTISVASITSRTFDLRVAVCTDPASRSDDDGEAPASKPREFEFSMIDSADFEAIAGYIRRHRLDAPELSGEQSAARAADEKASAKGTKQNAATPNTATQTGATAFANAVLDSSDDEDDEDFCAGSGSDSDQSTGTEDEDDGEASKDDKDSEGSSMEED